MGVGVSADFSKNEYLLRFVEKENISSNDPFWNRFLAFNVPSLMCRDENLMLEAKLKPFCEKLLNNNVHSNNIGTLIKVFLIKASELVEATNTSDTLFIWHTHNALFIIRCVLKYMMETLTEEQVLAHLENKSDSEEHTRLFIGSLIEILVDIPVLEITYLVHLEAVLCLIIFLTVQLNSTRTDSSVIYHIIMKGRHAVHAPLLVKNLLQSFIDQKKLPPSFGSQSYQSMVLGLASGLWSMITFKKDNNNITNDNMFEEPLASQSLLLLLLLTNICTNEKNPYRQCLFTCSDSTGSVSNINNQITSFKIDYSQLYSTICKCAGLDTVTLLEYILLHRNTSFKLFIVQRDDIDELVIPILKTLYSVPNCNSHHIYMSLIIILILSEDDSFNKKIHHIQTKRSNTWFTERNLPYISLGGLLVLVIIRTIQYNMLKMRDKYLHTNCLAALANMSACFSNLHPYVCQRFLSLFETLAKRYYKLQEKLKFEKDKKDSCTVDINNEETDIEQDITVLEEVLRMILEILNSCLSNQLTKNENLVYTLLYKKDIFDNCRRNTVFADIMKNLDVIIKYFSDLLERRQPHQENDYQEVFSLIHQEAKYWPKDKLTKFPELKFKYVEEDHPEEFFIPYVWSLVVKHSLLHWNINDVALLSTVC